eukprot:scaffold105234_cov22-Tisochrysis_lutea.AAC.1
MPCTSTPKKQRSTPSWSYSTAQTPSVSKSMWYTLGGPWTRYVPFQAVDNEAARSTCFQAMCLLFLY